MTGLGRLAGGEVIEMPVPASGPATALTEDKMEVDEVGSGAATPKVEDGKAQGQGQGQGPPQAQGGGGKGKKKKGKK